MRNHNRRMNDDRDFNINDKELAVIDDIPLGENGKHIHVSIRQAEGDDPVVSAVKIGGKYPNAKLGKFFDPEIAHRLGQAYINAAAKLEEIIKQQDEEEEREERRRSAITAA